MGTRVPGRWAVSVEEAGSNPSIYIEAPGYGTVAKMGGGDLATRLSLARVIAASPRVLAALVEIVRQFDAAPRQEHCDPGLLDAVAEARAAITEATGSGEGEED